MEARRTNRRHERGRTQSYAAHAARFLADRNSPARVTGVYVGWRGARTDENWLQRYVPLVGPWVGNALAALTLFDRKPVSEAIAPSVLSALRAVEDTLKLPKPRTAALKENRMIVFGHSLGGNILASAIGEDLIKKIRNHKPADYMLPVLGDLVVLLNPASEATKWTSFQREVWRRVAMAEAERAPGPRGPPQDPRALRRGTAPPGWQPWSV